jgi:hypothetical protein
VDKLIENIRNPYTPLAEQRRQLDLVHKLNEMHSQDLQKEAQLEARLQAYEMAFKMQTEATDAFDLNKEPQAMRDLYGRSTQGNQMLIARRLIERGVRFVQVWAGGWDHHRSEATQPVRQHPDCLGRRIRTKTRSRSQWKRQSGARSQCQSLYHAAGRRWRARGNGLWRHGRIRFRLSRKQSAYS